MSLALETRPAAPDFAAIKQRQQATWASGDFAVIGTTLQIVGESLAEAVDVRAGERVLDVAAGNGNATLAAARRFAEVTSTDYVPALLDKGRERARGRGAVGASSRSPTPKNCRSPTRASTSCCRPSARCSRPTTAAPRARCCACCAPAAASAWRTGRPKGFIGRLFKVIGAHVPPPAGVEVAGPVGHRAAHRRAVRRAGDADPLRAAHASTSATARPRIGCRCSAISTARRTRPSPRSTRTASRRWSATSRRCSSR